MTHTLPLVSLCMIVRDSAATLPACLESIRPWVDELIVTDTGSVDNTREIAARFDARVFEFPWIDDFAAARNESLRHATGQWLFWMDSDDTIDEENGRRLRELVYGQHAANILGYVMQVHCPSPSAGGGDETTLVDHVKLIRNHPEIRFEGRIHEQVLPSIRRLGGEVGWTDLFVSHSGADHSPEAKQRKYERDLRILRLDLAERPDHPFVLFNLGMTYDDMGQHQEAEGWLRKCLAVSDPGESHVRKAFALLASSLDRQGKPHEAHEVCRRGLEVFPEDDELLFRVAILEHRAHNLEAAVRAFRRVLEPLRPRHFTSIDRGIVGYKARHNLALVYEDAGRLDLAELQWRKVLDESAGYEPALRGLQRLLRGQNRSTTAAVEREQQAATHNSITADRSENSAVAAGEPGSEFELPACHSRREFHPQRRKFFCAHPGVGAIESLVSPEFCAICPYWKQPPPSRFRRPPDNHPPHSNVPCSHLGPQVDLRLCTTCRGKVHVKVFACGHPAHRETTLDICRQCRDYTPAAQGSLTSLQNPTIESESSATDAAELASPTSPHVASENSDVSL